MGERRNIDEHMERPPSSSYGLWSWVPSENFSLRTGTSGASGAYSGSASRVQGPWYREHNMALNKIYIQPPYITRSFVLTKHISEKLRAERKSLQPPTGQLEQTINQPRDLETSCSEKKSSIVFQQDNFPQHSERLEFWAYHGFRTLN